jgi:hypothetical protein
MKSAHPADLANSQQRRTPKNSYLNQWLKSALARRQSEKPLNIKQPAKSGRYADTFIGPRPSSPA